MIALQHQFANPSSHDAAPRHATGSPRIQQTGGLYVLEDEVFLPQPCGEVFEFFSDAANLARITPDSLEFTIVTPQPIVMSVGTLIDYRLKVRGVPIRWRSRITVWDPPHCFVDEQVRGPYRLWRHTHMFIPESGGTRVGDRVEFLSRGGPLAPLLHRLLVNRDVRFIFAHRRRTLERLFGC